MSIFIDLRASYRGLLGFQQKSLSPVNAVLANLTAKICLLSQTLACSLLLSGLIQAGPPSTITVDTSKPQGPDLVQKFDMSQTGHSNSEQWSASATGRIRPLGLKHVRISGAGLHTTLHQGTPLLQGVLDLLKSEGAAAYVCLGPDRWDHKTPSVLDPEIWKSYVRDVVRQCKPHGTVYYQTWNEPNYKLFFDRPKELFFELFRDTVEAVREVDPDARFVGPGAVGAALDFTRPFLEYVDTHDLPLDAFSFHDFGRGYRLGEDHVIPHARLIEKELARFPRFKETTIHVGECSFFKDPKDGQAADRTAAAAQLPNFFRQLLEHPRIDLVQWAQLFDTGHPGHWGNLGVIDAERQQSKAIYNAWLMYAMMPLVRLACVESGPAQAMASRDRNTVAVLLYNRTDQDSAVSLSVEGEGQGFRAGREIDLLRLAIDRDHSSFWEQNDSDGRLELVEHRKVRIEPRGDAEFDRESVKLELDLPGPGLQLVLLTTVVPDLPEAVIAVSP